jgi:glycosyltransferase involved in cell wall biosynthesis
MKSPTIDLKKHNIAVVIPCYRVELEINSVIASLPRYLKHIIVVDDASPDRTSELVLEYAKKDRRIILIRHEQNQGVGGALITGFQKALELGAQIVVKVDGDGQMDLDYLPDLIVPLIEGRADYTKGNRFRDFQSLQKMPLIRRIGNMGLGFLANCHRRLNLLTWTNGFVAIRARYSHNPTKPIDHTFSSKHPCLPIYICLERS